MFFAWTDLSAVKKICFTNGSKGKIDLWIKFAFAKYFFDVPMQTTFQKTVKFTSIYLWWYESH